MSKPALSIRIFAVYLFVFAVVLILIPNELFSVLQVPETNEVWIRVVGVLLVVLSYYYFMASYSEMADFFKWTVHARLFLLFTFLIFVVAGLAPPVLALFGVIDGLAALWTASGLRKHSDSS